MRNGAKTVITGSISVPPPMNLKRWGQWLRLFLVHSFSREFIHCLLHRYLIVKEQLQKGYNLYKIRKWLSPAMAQRIQYPFRNPEIKRYIRPGIDRFPLINSLSVAL